MADAKWIRDLDANMPLRQAAKVVLGVRLCAVDERLPLAAEHAADDVEHVHQLRVGTRRAGAALRIFAPLLPDRFYRKARRHLRRLRRAAGAARDWDVFLETVTQRRERGDGGQRHGLDFLIGFGHGQRVLAQEQLRVTASAEADYLPTLRHDLANVLVAEGQDATLRDLAVPTLTELVRDLADAAHGDLSDYERLHQVRILGKKLRYAMEVFENCFEPSFRDRYYPAVEQMQEILGQANDSRVAVGRLTSLREHLQRTQPKQWPVYRPGMDALLRFHQRRLPQRRQAFGKWWKLWESSGAEQAFADVIHA